MSGNLGTWNIYQRGASGGPVHDEGAQEATKVRSSPSVAGGSSAELTQDDPLFRWMQDRQTAFKEFESSFHEPSSFGTSGLLAAPTRRSLFNQPSSLDFDTPRMLSSRNNNQEMAPKAKVTYDEGKFQVDFDVQEYRPEELSIKTEGDVLVVLAEHETKEDEGKGSGSYVTKQFEQRFTLPSGVKPEDISSALSKEGVLTVSAPREVVRKTSQTIGGFNKTRGALEETFTPQSTVQGDQGLPHPRVKYDDDKFQISLDCKKYRPEELDVKVEGNTIIITAKQEIKEVGGTRTRVFEQKFTLPSGVKADKVTSSIDRDGLLTITAPRGNVSASSINQTIEERMDRVLAPSNWEDSFGSGPSDARRKSTTTTTTQTSSTSNNLMPATGDSFFDRDFGDRSLFKHCEALDTDGVSKVHCEDGKYKIFVNAKNYRPEELVIKTVGTSVHVEAKHMEKTTDGHSYSSRNFTQSFSLPKGVNPEEVTSSLNREGQLVIEAPLPQSLKSSGERLVPIKHH